MNELTDGIWIAGGGAAGVLQATLLWRSVQRFAASPPGAGMLRLGLVAATLVGGALCGRILPAAVGWGIAFATSASCYAIGSAGSRPPESPAVDSAE